jgi:hypothetical protein
MSFFKASLLFFWSMGDLLSSCGHFKSENDGKIWWLTMIHHVFFVGTLFVDCGTARLNPYIRVLKHFWMGEGIKTAISKTFIAVIYICIYIHIYIKYCNPFRTHQNHVPFPLLWETLLLHKKTYSHYSHLYFIFNMSLYYLFVYLLGSCTAGSIRCMAMCVSYFWNPYFNPETPIQCNFASEIHKFS